MQDKELGDGSGCGCGRVAHHGCCARPTVLLEQWACIVDGVGSSDPFEEHEEEEEASLENVAAEDLATKFREAYEMCLDEL